MAYNEEVEEENGKFSNSAATRTNNALTLAKQKTKTHNAPLPTITEFALCGRGSVFLHKNAFIARALNHAQENNNNNAVLTSLGHSHQCNRKILLPPGVIVKQTKQTSMKNAFYQWLHYQTLSFVLVFFLFCQVTLLLSTNIIGNLFGKKK